MKSASQKRIERYISERLLKVLGGGSKSRRFKLTETALGAHSQVYFLDVDGRPPMVLKSVRKRDRFKSMLSCAAYLAESGIRTPRVIYSEEDRRMFGRLGFHVMVEERVEGKTLREMPDADRKLPEVGRFFADLHALSRSTWGKVDAGKTGGLYEYFKNKADEKLKRWRNYDGDFPDGLQGRLDEWFASHRESLGQIRTFSLSHCDPNPGNIMLDDQGRVFILDTGHIRYLPRAVDYYTLQVNLCRGDSEMIKALESAYCETVPPEELADLKKNRPFFELYVLVNFAAMLARSRAAGSSDPYYDDYGRYLGMARGRAQEIVS